MDRSGAAGAEQRVVARIAAALGDVHARRARHVLVDDVVDAPRHLDEREPDALGQPRERGARGFDVHRDLAAREVVGVEVAEQQVGVGHRRLGPAEAVGGGPGLRARAPRPDLQQTDLVHLRDAAAAGADLDQLDRRDADGKPAALEEALLARRLEVIRRQRLSAVDERELGGRAAHVEGEQVAAGVLAAEERGRDGARRRARLQHPNGRALRPPARG